MSYFDCCTASVESNQLADRYLHNMRAVKREHALPVYNRYSSYYTAVFVDRMQNNAKVKAFRAQFRGVRDIPFFIFRLAKIFA